MSDRIAIFQYEWPLQVHTVNLAAEMANSGYHVDLFLLKCDIDFVGTDELEKTERITVYDLTPGFTQRMQQKIGRILERDIESPADRPIIPPWVEKETLRLLEAKKYKCFIGIEKKGLIWAGRLAKVVQVPYLYYSLELYLEDHPAFTNDPGFTRLRQEEIEFHRTSMATIIQDRARAGVLLASNGIERTDLLFLPVSLPGNEHRNKSRWLHEHNNLPSDKKILLYFGKIDEDRLCFEMAETANLLNDSFIMIFHGVGSRKVIAELRSRRKFRNLVLSLKLVTHHEITEVISSATIGLVIYGNSCNNDRLTAFSSEKMALFLQSGIPIIAFDMGNYRDLMDTHRCGELIKDMKELPSAIDKIMQGYEKYREEAFAAYREFYRYDNHINKIETYLSAL